MSNIPLYQEMRQKAAPLWQDIFALACAKSRDLGEMGAFATLLSVTLNMEMELHRKNDRPFRR